jgi:hypothetical protein
MLPTQKTLAKEGFLLSTHTNERKSVMKKDMLLQDPIAQSVIDELVRNEDLAFYVASVSINIDCSLNSSRLGQSF